MEKISPEKYREILEGIELQSISLKTIKATIAHENLSDKMNISFKDEAFYTYEEDGFLVENKYILTAKNNQRKNVLKIECIYLLYFTSVEEITDDFFEIYKEISLPLNVWPFFRELVNSVTSRMNIPPLTLPLLKR